MASISALLRHPLTRFIARRTGAMAVILVMLVFAFFFFMDLAPGDYFSSYLLNPDIDKSVIQNQREQFGLDQPFYVQLWLWVKNLVTKGDLGVSFSYRQPILDLIGTRLPNTLALNLLSLLVTYAVVYPLSLYFAYKPRKWLDKGVDISTLLLYSMPGFFLALLGLMAAAATGWFPINGATSPGYETMNAWQQFSDRLHHLLLPVIVGFLGGIAGTIRTMKVLLHEEFGKPYIVASRARGLGGASIVLHALRNALVPFISGMSGLFASLLSGSLFIEIIYGYPGLGKLMYEALLKQDYYLVLTNMVVVSVLALLGNLLSDILLAVADPRVRMR